MTALVLADLHLTENTRDAYRHEFIKGVGTQAIKHGADQIIILGDLTEEKDRHGAWLTNAIVDYIVDMTKVAFVIIVRGNHDYRSIETPYFKFLRHLDKVTWIEEPEKRKVGRLGECLFLPHTRNYKKDWPKLSSNLDWIFAHNTFKGAKSESGRELEGIPVDVFPKGVPVVSGDIHVPQKVGGVVTYVGAPYTIDFGDEFAPRMLLLNGDTMKSIPCNGPQKRLLDFATPADLKKRGNVNKGDIVKVRFHLKQADVPAWPKTRQMVTEWAKEHGYLLHALVPVVSHSSKPKHESEVTGKDDADIVDSFSDKSGVDDRTRKVGHIIVEDVK